MIYRVSGRVLLGVVLVAACVGVAMAAPKKRKVKIETEPAGATVYLDAKEDGPVCTTPCTIDAPVGDTPIIVELENHKQIFENLSVPARKAMGPVKFKLVPAIGTISVTGPAGARITVDDLDKGKAPTKIEVGAGAHTVILTVDGKQIATEFVTVAANDEVEVSAKSKRTARTDPDEDEEDEEEEEVSVGNGDPAITTTAKPGRPRGAIISLAGRMDVGFRSFTYEEPETPNLTPETEGGQVLVGPQIEVWPGTALGIHALRGLSLLVRFGYGVNAQIVKDRMTGNATGATTFWRSFETSLRHRWTVADTATIEVGGGFVRDQHQFEGDSLAIKNVPDADYQSIRFGLRLSLLFGKVEPYLAAENRLVLSGGPLAARFDSASASGLRGAAGLAMSFGAIGARVEGALTRYSWTFTANEADDEFRATGGVDSIKYVSLLLDYAY
jgi:hypothetical protein